MKMVKVKKIAKGFASAVDAEAWMAQGHLSGGIPSRLLHKLLKGQGAQGLRHLRRGTRYESASIPSLLS